MSISASNFIQPIESWQKNGKIYDTSGSSQSVTGTGSMPFSSVFQTAIEQVHTTQAEVENQQYLLATGQLEDAHTLPIAEAKAQVSLDMLISLRNKAMEAYNELMKMSI